MAYVPQRPQFSFRTLFNTATDYWQGWRSACDRAIVNYYNQRIEMDPEGEAQQYWNRISHPRSAVDLYQISDAMLSRLMQTLIDKGISKFAVDRFILALRRQVRAFQSQG